MKEKKNYEEYIPENEETRSWFKVSSNRKKIWNIELWLLEELKKICKKHNIRYFADWWTLLWAIRHKWFIPRDDDIDLVMFREDYEKFRKIAQKELPSHIKLAKYHQWFSKLININTAALWYENWRDKDFIGGIRIDIFPIDYASKSKIINKIKSFILLFLRAILVSQKCYWFLNTMEKKKKIFVSPLKFIFKKINTSKIYNLHEKIAKKVFFKSKNVYSAGFVYRYFPAFIYEKAHNINFENTTICIPNWYDVYLKTSYWDYMKPIIYQWWHSCRYSTEISYTDIIKWFNKSKSNEENYNNCKSLFLL